LIENFGDMAKKVLKEIIRVIHNKKEKSLDHDYFLQYLDNFI
jgi:hypothetical protein